jgi:hypothetical protein
MDDHSRHALGALDILGVTGIGFAALMPAFVLVTLYLGDLMPVIEFCAVFWTCAGLMALLRWVNDRQDLRHAKRPPDDP